MVAVAIFISACCSLAKSIFINHFHIYGSFARLCFYSALEYPAQNVSISGVIFRRELSAEARKSDDLYREMPRYDARRCSDAAAYRPKMTGDRIACHFNDAVDGGRDMKPVRPLG